MSEKLIVGAELDPTGVSAGLDETLSLLKQAGRDMQRAVASFDFRVPDIFTNRDVDQLSRRGGDAGEALVSSLSNAFERESAEAREALFRGLIDEATFKRRGTEAAETFNAGLLAGMDDLAAKGALSGFLTERLVAELKDAGLQAGHAAGEGVADGLRERRAAIETSMRSIGRTMSDVGRDLSIGVTAPLVGLTVAATKFSTEFESALAGVEKTTDLSTEQVRALGVELRALSEIPGFGDAAAIAGIAEMGGQLGIATDALIPFAKTVAQLDLASNLNADEAANGLARIANITNLPDSQFENLSSAIVAVGNAGAATEKEILELSLRLAGVGTQVGLSQADIVGFAGGLADVGLEAEAGGTAFSRVFAEIGKAAQSGGPALAQFAAVAGESVADFQKAFKEDAAGAVVSFIEGLDDLAKSGQNVFAILETLGFDDMRVRDALLRTAGAGDRLGESIQNSRKAFAEGAAAGKEFNVFASTTAAELSAARNGLKNVTAELGDGLNPALRDAIGIQAALLQPLRGLVKGFNELPEPVRLVAVSVGVVLAAVGPLLFAAGQLAQSLVVLRAASIAVAGAQGLGALVGGAGLAGGALAGLGSVLLPAGAVLAGLALLAAAFYKSGQAAREAAAFADQFRASVQGMAGQRLLIETNGAVEELERLKAKKRDLERVLAIPMKVAEPGQFQGAQDQRAIRQAIIEQKRLRQETQRQLDDVNARLPNAQANVDALGARWRKVAAEEAAAAQAARDAIEASKRQAEEMAKAIRAGLGADFFGNGAKDAAKSFTQLAETVRATVASTAQLRGNVVAAVDLARIRASLEDTVLAALRAQSDQYGTQAVALREMLKDLREASRLTVSMLDPKKLPTPGPGSPVKLDERFTPAPHIVDPKVLAEARRQAGGLRLELKGMTQGARGLLQIGTALGKIGDSARDAIDGVLSLVDAFSGFKDARKAIESAEKAMEAAQKAKDAKAIETAQGAMSAANLAQITSVIGAIGGAVSMLSGLFSGLFGKSELDREREAMLQRNNEALADLRIALDRSTQSLGGRAEIAADVQRIGMRGFAEAVQAQFIKNFSGGKISGAELIDRQLREMGSSLEQVDAIARDLGLTLRDSKGYFDLTAVQQFVDAIALSADAARKFTSDLAGQRAGQEFMDDVFDIDMTPALRFQREVALLASTTTGLADGLVGLDVDTAAGRAAAEAALRELAEAAKAGRITAEQFGDLDSIDDLVSIIIGADNALDEFAETAREAVGAMVNVPQGFKLALRAFEAQLPAIPAAVAPYVPPAIPAPNTPPPGHTRNPAPNEDGRTRTGDTFNFAPGSIVVDARDATGDELLDKVTRAARTRASAMSGDRTPAYEAIR